MEHAMFLRDAFVTAGGKEFHTRIAFEIYKGYEIQDLNKSQITLYNLSEDSKRVLARKEGTVILNAGYQGYTPMIFSGDYGMEKVGDFEAPPVVCSERKGADIVTTIELADGDYAANGTNVSISLGKGTTIDQIFNVLTGALGIPKGSIPASLGNFQYVKGFAYIGTTKNLLTQICKKAGMKATISNGHLHVFDPNIGTGETAVLLNESSGLIGVPNQTANGFRAKSFLNPLLYPGRQVKVESKSLTKPAIFVIQRVKHTGDTYEGDWYSEIEGGQYAVTNA